MPFSIIIKIIINPLASVVTGSFLYTSDDTRFPVGIHICPCGIRRHTRLGSQSSLSFTVAGINASESEIESEITSIMLLCEHHNFYCDLAMSHCPTFGSTLFCE
jgi:hypothetical protein